MDSQNQQRITPLIAFAGRARCGKDTAALHLLRHYNFETYSFAAPIKRALVSMFDFSFEHVEGELKEKDLAWLGVSPRRLMQTLGTEWGRNLIGEDVWIKTLEQDIRNDMRMVGQTWGGAAISDVRMHNEAAWVRGQGGVIVHIQRNVATSVAPHITEVGLERVAGDVVITNNGSLCDFENKLDGLMRALNITTGTVIANG